MSNLQKSITRQKLVHHPAMPIESIPEIGNEQTSKMNQTSTEGGYDSSSSASSMSSTGTIKPLASKNLFARPQGSVSYPSFPLSKAKAALETRADGIFLCSVFLPTSHLLIKFLGPPTFLRSSILKTNRPMRKSFITFTSLRLLPADLYSSCTMEQGLLALLLLSLSKRYVNCSLTLE